MIIKGESKNGIDFKKWSLIATAIAALAFLLFKVGTLTKKNDYSKRLYECNAEKSDSTSFFNEQESFLNGQTISSERSLSGKFSSKLNPSSKYGLGYQLNDLLPGDLVEVSIWFYGSIKDCYLAMHSNEESNIFYKAQEIVEEKDGWSKILYKIRIPVKPLVNSLRIFSYFHATSGEAFFDDLTIKINDTNTFYDKSELALPKLSIYIDDKGYSAIKGHREKAMEDGILMTDKNSWVKAKLSIKDSIEHEVKLRLKGDWTDHLEGNKWSFRIKMPNDASWRGMTEFSLQNPNTRGLLNEWVFHNLMQYEDVLTTRYDFVKLEVNGTDLGIYAFEEHLMKQLPESNNRREGVIMRFSEAEFWNQRLQASKDGYKRDALESLEFNKANIEAFNESKIPENPGLLEQLNKASELLYQYQHGLADVDEIFDLPKMAKHYAIIDLMDAYHGIIWHNQRFYYNPIIRKLEPIGFDGYTGMGSMALNHKPFYGAFYSSIPTLDNYNINAKLFSDEKFSALYAQQLAIYSDPVFIEGYYEANIEKIRFREDIIQTEFAGYTFDLEKLKTRSRQIKHDIYPVKNQSLKAYKKDCTAQNCAISVTNNHFLPIVVIGTSRKENGKIHHLDSTVFVRENVPNKTPKFKEINIPINDKFIVYKGIGADSTFYENLKVATAPGIINITANEQNLLQIPLSENQFINVNHEIVILKGEYELKSPLIVPKNYTLRISEGTKFNLSKGAYILVYGRVSLLGSAEDPILISGNKDNQGFVVMGGGSQRSTINHTYFSGLNCLTENEWQLTGAVTIYESDVDINNSSFSHNHSEDALNIIRSNFKIDRTGIHHTLFDGLDSDFCTGEIVNSTIHHTGNDGLDFSGSTIQVSDCTISSPGDKGISAGEKSTIRVGKISISNASIAIAAKDLSIVSAIDVNLEDSDIGFTAYRKKPEFGGAKIHVSKLSHNNVNHLSLADEESQINLPVSNVAQ